MRIFVTVSALFLVLTTLQAEQSSSSEAPKDADLLLGTWTAVDGEYQGAAMNKDEVRKLEWIFTADGVSYTMLEQKKAQGKYKLDPSASPKTFEFKGDSPLVGIYELKGDTLKVCFAAGERPKGFNTAGTSQDTLMLVFKKKKK
jgi:uncharacterized protein (TIGR03067 family)